jgi:hypothetical protein
VFAALSSWGLRHRPSSGWRDTRAQLLQAGPELWDRLMVELRVENLGVPDPNPDQPSVIAQISAAASVLDATD